MRSEKTVITCCGTSPGESNRHEPLKLSISGPCNCCYAVIKTLSVSVSQGDVTPPGCRRCLLSWNGSNHCTAFGAVDQDGLDSAKGAGSPGKCGSFTTRAVCLHGASSFWFFYA